MATDRSCCRTLKPHLGGQAIHTEWDISCFTHNISVSPLTAAINVCAFECIINIWAFPSAVILKTSIYSLLNKPNRIIVKVRFVHRLLKLLHQFQSFVDCVSIDCCHAKHSVPRTARVSSWLPSHWASCVRVCVCEFDCCCFKLRPSQDIARPIRNTPPSAVHQCVVIDAHTSPPHPRTPIDNFTNTHSPYHTHIHTHTPTPTQTQINIIHDDDTLIQESG